MEKFYIDHEADFSVAYIFEDREVVFAGVGVHREAERLRNHELVKVFVEEEFHFFFQNDAVELDFYAVPFLCVAGHDGAGGWFVAKRSGFSFHKNDPLYYLSVDKEMFAIKDSAAFLQGGYRWRDELTPSDLAEIFPSKAEAEKKYELHNERELAAQFGVEEL